MNATIAVEKKAAVRELILKLQKDMDEKNEVPVVLLPLLAEGDGE